MILTIIIISSMALYFISHFLTGQKSSIKNNLILKNSDMKVLKNVILDDFGIVKKRPGSTKVGNNLASSNILGLHDFAKNDGTHKQLTVNAAKVYYNNAGTWTDSGITGLTTGKRTRFVNFVNLVFLVNGTQAVKDWDGATAYDAQVGSAPVANYISVFTDRLYTNNTTYPSRINYTTIPTAGVIAWTGGDSGYYEVQTDDGDFVTGIHPRRDRLLIFKNHYIEARDSYFRRISIVRDLGTPSNDSIVTINNKTYFFNFDDTTSTGVYEYGSSEPIKISAPIQDLIDDITIATPSTQFFATKYGMNYILHIGTTQGMSNVVICYNVTHQAWCYWTLPSTITTFAPYNDTNVILPNYGTSLGKVYKFTGANDAYYNGSTDTTKNITMNVRTHPIHCGNPHLFKDFTNIYLFDENPIKSRVRYQIDRGSWLSAGQIENRTSILGAQGKGYDIIIQIEDNSLSSPEIKGLVIEYSVEENSR